MASLEPFGLLFLFFQSTERNTWREAKKENYRSLRPPKQSILIGTILLLKPIFKLIN